MDRLITLDTLLDGLAEHGDKPAVIAFRKKDSKTWSYAELLRQARQLAHGLTERAGVRPGDPVAVLASNRPEWIVAALGILQAGAVVVPIDVQFSDEVLSHVLVDSGARTVFTTTNQSERF